MDLRQLQTFQAVAQTLNFTQAAEQLDYAQSSVTAQIQSLERELGVLLFERLGKRVALTRAGERLLEYAGKILKLADEARAAVVHDAEPSGKLHLSAPETLSAYRLPPLLRAFRQHCPGVQITLQSIGDRETFGHLTSGRVDLAFTLTEPRRLPPELEFITLTREPLLLLSAPDAPLAQQERVAFEDLRHETLLLTETNCTYRTLFESRLAAAGVRLTSPMDFGSVEAIKQCVMAGIGTTFLPEIAVVSELRQGRLVALDWPEADLHVYTHLLWHKDKHLTPALHAFIELSRALFCVDPAAVFSIIDTGD
jgi:DNA-binding transcriptional LysR family regulator